MSQRTERVGKVARQVLGDAIRSLKDPRVGFVTVTAVRVSADLRHARVAVSVLGDEAARKASLAGLESAKPVLRGELGRQMRMKYLPDLTFVLDEGAERAERIEELLHKIHEHDQGDE
ncbi:MAG TPA: 30S ribosome-binding factor RbfA [Actinomycetota bacterium]|nr:30S ribosome-binding factor RbfA [Actinomycetota bacterium]